MQTEFTRFKSSARRGLLSAMGLMLGAWAFPCGAQTASYDATSRYLTMSSVQVLDALYSNVVIRLDGVSVVTIGSNNQAQASSSTNATYDPAQRTLTLPMVSALGAVYYGLVARLDSFALISVGAPASTADPATSSDRYSYYY